MCKIKPSHQKTWLCCRKPRLILFHFMHHWQPDSVSTLFSGNVCTLISLLDWAYSAGRKLLFRVVKHTSQSERSTANFEMATFDLLTTAKPELFVLSNLLFDRQCRTKRPYNTVSVPLQDALALAAKQVYDPPCPWSQLFCCINAADVWDAYF